MSSNNIPLLTNLEREVILLMAKIGPVTGYSLHGGGDRTRSIRTSHKPIMSSRSWHKIRLSLGPKGENLITTVQLKGRGRERKKKPMWLTSSGVVYALVNEASPELLLQHVRTIYPEDMNLQFTLEVAGMVGKDIVQTGFHLNTQQFGKVDPGLLTSIMAQSSKGKEGEKRLRRLMQLLKKYPQFKDYKKNLMATRTRLDQLFTVFEQAYDEESGNK